MLQRKVNTNKNYILLNQKSPRKNNYTYLRQSNTLRKKKTCLIALLNPTQLNHIFKYLSLTDLVKLEEAMNFSRKTKDGAKLIMIYLIRRDKVCSEKEQKQFIAFNVFKNKKLNKYRMTMKVNEWKDKESINLDVERTYISSCKKREQIQLMKIYMKRVLYSLASQFPKIGYVQGFHYLIKAMYENNFSEQEAFLFTSFILRDMKAQNLYLNQMQRIKELCYVLEVYIYNNLPELYSFFKKYEISAEIYAISWFITLFAEQLPLLILNKLWNLFLIKGWKVMIKFGISVLCAFEKEIMCKSESQVHGFLRGILLQITKHKQQLIWQVMSSIKATNHMIDYLSKGMEMHHHDSEISIWQLKLKRKEEEHRLSNDIEDKQKQAFLQNYSSLSLCCERVQTSANFPYCATFD